jgi:hypothetical protein
MSPEFSHYRVFGTLNMTEESNFFGSKMLEIEDSIKISDVDITWYQNFQSEQLDFSIESSGQPSVYSSNLDKQSNHTLQLDESQPTYQKENKAKWILTINTSSILANYLFSIMKKHRTFEGLKRDMTIYNDVNVALRKYIELNVMNRYKLSGIELYISYQDLRKQPLLRYKNTWSKDVDSGENRVTRIQQEVSIDKKTNKLFFTQEKPTSDWSMKYYYNLNFVKI